MVKYSRDRVDNMEQQKLLKDSNKYNYAIFVI